MRCQNINKEYTNIHRHLGLEEKKGQGRRLEYGIHQHEMAFNAIRLEELVQEVQLGKRKILQYVEVGENKKGSNNNNNKKK